MRPLVAEEVIAVAQAVAVVVERLSVVARDDDDRLAGDPVGLERIEHALRRVVDRRDGSVVEGSDLLLVARVGRRLGPETDGLVVLEAPPVARVGEPAVVRRGRGVREVRRREEDHEKEGSARLERPHRAHGVVREHLRVGGVVHLAQDRERSAPHARVEHGQEGRLALEHALAHELAKVELGDVDRGKPQVDAREDVAGVVADDARGPSRAAEALGQRVEVACPLFPAREHRADPVVMGVAPRQPRHP